MWFFRIFKILWDDLFALPIGVYGLSFGGLLLGVFIITFLTGFVSKFMHRGE